MKHEPLLNDDEGDPGPDSARNRARCVRSYVLWLFVCVCAVQGVTWSVFASLPTVAESMFPGLSDADLAWQMNAYNLMQVFTVPFSAWLLTQRVGLRWTMLAGVSCQLLQAVLWAATAAAPLDFRRTVTARGLLVIGAAAGGSGEAKLK